jgi:hypothetical protein
MPASDTAVITVVRHNGAALVRSQSNMGHRRNDVYSPSAGNLVPRVGNDTTINVTIHFAIDIDRNAKHPVSLADDIRKTRCVNSGIS